MTFNSYAKSTYASTFEKSGQTNPIFGLPVQNLTSA